MKKTYILFFSLLLSTFAFSQDRIERNEKIKALKVAYITEKLDLTKAEAEKFWPIYNAFEEKAMALREKSHSERKSIDYDALSETEAKRLIEDYRKTYSERNKLYDTFISDLLNVIPAKKVVLLKKTEDDFKRKMFEEYKKRRHEKRNRP